MPGLRDILDAATAGPWELTEPEDSWHFKLASIICLGTSGSNDLDLAALAPELAALCLDMGAFIRGETPDDECDVPGCTDPWCCDHDADALLARLDSIGKEQTP